MGGGGGGGVCVCVLGVQSIVSRIGCYVRYFPDCETSLGRKKIGGIGGAGSPSEPHCIPRFFHSGKNSFIYLPTFGATLYPKVLSQRKKKQLYVLTYLLAFNPRLCSGMSPLIF